MIIFFELVIPALIAGFVGHSVYKFVADDYVDRKFIVNRDAWDIGWITGLLIEFVAIGSFFIPLATQNDGLVVGWLVLTCLLVIGFVRKLMTVRMKIKAQREYRHNHSTPAKLK